MIIFHFYFYFYFMINTVDAIPLSDYKLTQYTVIDSGTWKCAHNFRWAFIKRILSLSKNQMTFLCTVCINTVNIMTNEWLKFDYQSRFDQKFTQNGVHKIFAIHKMSVKRCTKKDDTTFAILDRLFSTVRKKGKHQHQH